MEASSSTTSGQKAAFVILAILLALRLIRFLGTAIGFILYRPVVPQEAPAFTSRDCSVIFAVTRPQDPALERQVRSVLHNDPCAFYIVTVGKESRDQLDRLLAPLRIEFPNTQISIGAVNSANKRRQISHALRSASTRITVLIDDGVFWPRTFLKSAMAPFKDLLVGAITVRKRVCAVSNSLWDSFWACLASIYYSYLDHESRCANAVDGSVSYGDSTALYRTPFLAQNFVDDFEAERCCFGRIGPLRADEYHYFNTWMLQNDNFVRVQSSPGCTVDIAFQSPTKFLGDCERMARGQWRSSISMLCFFRENWRFPWAIYSVWLHQLVSFPLFFDAIVILLFTQTRYFVEEQGRVAILFCILLAMKVLHTLPMWFCGAQGPFRLASILLCWFFLIPIGYLHTLLKAKALLTYWHVERAECLKSDEEMARQCAEPAWIWGHTGMMYRRWRNNCLE
ncbi:hypothetical protein FZEAL_10401 [Fusarium zealandicum]|uniref:Uncharacterized protein n=1 Tax=Fusarium zealandicum TaxID=1053134 RepID=A0A8H4U241_9HYPO|nr:hypothetical protein FZEAL_10401 [Fusarium zealandicum]